MQTLFIGQTLFFLHEVESTNTYASELLKNVNQPEGTIVYTDNQTKGRGQRGSVWRSDTGQNLTLSLILQPKFLSTFNHFYLSKITALALHDLLTELLLNSQFDTKIKWPNDIIVNQKKIAGILIENTVLQKEIQYSIIGIGLNINQTEFDTLENIATSLQLLTNKGFDRMNVLEKLCVYMEKWYLKLKASKLDEIDKTYLNHLFKVNELADFIDVKSGNNFKAMIINVTTEGKLTLKLENNNNVNFELKEVKLNF